MGILDAPFNANAYAKRGDSLKPVASWTMYANGNDIPTQSAAQTSRVPHVIGTAVTELRLVYMNTSLTAATWTDNDGGAAAYPISASVEISGVMYRVTFRGATTVSIDPGGYVVSDPLQLDLAAGTQIYTRTYINSTSWIPNIASYNASGTGGKNASDLTAPGASAVSDSVCYQFAPAAVIGKSAVASTPGVVVLGDSIDMGKGDNRTLTTYGFWNQTLRGNVGFSNLGVSGDSASNFVQFTKRYHRMKLVSLGTHMLEGYGRNELSTRTLAQIQADKITIWNLAVNRGMTVWARTITPQTTSTDSWATVGNQTNANASAETVRVALNTWIRAGAPMVSGAAVAVGTGGALVAGQTGHPLKGYVEVTDAVESARNSGIWKAAYTADGLHPTPAGHTAVVAAIPALSTWLLA